MIKTIKTITDRNLFHNILKKFFYNKNTFIYSPEGNVEVSFLPSSDGLVNLKTPLQMEELKNCVAFTRSKNNVIFVFLKYCGKKQDDIFLFNPAKFQVMSVERKDERRSFIENFNDKSILYITNFISDIIIGNSLTGQGMVLKRIREIIEYDHSNEYDYLKIFFWNENASDPRMRYFCSNRNPFLIPDASLDFGDDVFNYYKNNILVHDSYLKNHKELVSEISVPILFNSRIPYGYIQVNGSSSFPNSKISIVKRLALIVDELARKSNLFSVLNDKLLVSDISRKGVGIVFDNQRYIPYYRKDSYVAMDLMLPQLKKASILADVKHLELMQNRLIKVGFEIRDMDRVSQDNYERFLGSIGV